jgi:hypothetical protein
MIGVDPEGVAVVAREANAHVATQLAANKKLGQAGPRPRVLLERLEERCAFERATVRLYEAVLAKVIEKGSFDGGPTRDQLALFARAELNHFQLLAAALFAFGGDPSGDHACNQPSCAAVNAMTRKVRDPSTSMLEALQAILVAELVDAEGWEALLSLCRLAGFEGLADRFQAARREEVGQLVAVRAWLEANAMARLEAADSEVTAAP